MMAMLGRRFRIRRRRAVALFFLVLIVLVAAVIARNCGARARGIVPADDSSLATAASEVPLAATAYAAVASESPAAVGRARAPAGATFDSAGVSIFYTVEGKGDPVILIHGLNSSANLNWRAPGIISALAPSFTVIALDLRGHGQSGKPRGKDSYGTQLVEDVVRLMGHLKIKKAHIIGYSLGGMVATKLAVLHPDRVQSLILGGMGWFREGSKLQDLWDRLPARRGRTPAELVHSVSALAVSEADLKAIRAPAAVIVGDGDPVRKLYVVPLESVRKDWPVTLIKGAGHINCILKPQFKDALAKTLSAFPRPAPETK
jgi:pimeloyl-ACP methyl ester carboxylesterase